MELSVVELSKLLSVSPDTIERWIRQGKLPVSKKGSAYRFKTQELKRWAKINHIRLDLKQEDSTQKDNKDVSLSEAIQNGGVYSDIKGHDIDSVLACAVQKIPSIPEDQKDLLLEQLLERESALSTGIGKGVSIPHPRQPQTYLEHPLVCVCYLSEPVDYKALDDQPVTVLFCILCPVLKMHLQLLSSISFCLKDPSFIAFLATKPEEGDLVRKIESLTSSDSL